MLGHSVHWVIKNTTHLFRTPPPLKNSILSFKKVTKFLVEISQFELIMTWKNIFAYQLFLSLNIADFSLLFYVKIASSKRSPPLSTQPPLKINILSKPLFMKSW